MIYYNIYIVCYYIILCYTILYQTCRKLGSTIFPCSLRSTSFRLCCIDIFLLRTGRVQLAQICDLNTCGGGPCFSAGTLSLTSSRGIWKAVLGMLFGTSRLSRGVGVDRCSTGCLWVEFNVAMPLHPIFF